jgi:ribosomal protein L37E
MLSRMIDLGSIAGLHERQHELHAYCHRCDRWQGLDLESLVRAGQGARQLCSVVARCRRCGAVGALQVRPPAPLRAASGWITPPTEPAPPPPVISSAPVGVGLFFR